MKDFMEAVISKRESQIERFGSDAEQGKDALFMLGIVCGQLGKVSDALVSSGSYYNQDPSEIKQNVEERLLKLCASILALKEVVDASEVIERD